MGPCSPLKVQRFDSIQILRKTKFLSSYFMQNRGAFLFLYHPRIPAIDPVFLMYWYENKEMEVSTRGKWGRFILLIKIRLNE